MKKFMKKLIRIYKFLEFIERQRIKAMIYSGRGWG